MARALGIAVDTYKKYETRSKSTLPSQHVQAFLEAIGGGPDECYFLFTGRMSKQENSRTTEEQVRV